MITLAEPDPYLLAESEQRPTQQDDRERKKDTGSVYVLQPEERHTDFPAGGNRIRTIGPSREIASVLFDGMAAEAKRKRGRHSRGTDGSNPSSSDESANLGVVSLGVV